MPRSVWSTQQFAEFTLQPDQAEQAYFGGGIELGGQVDVAFGAVLIPGDAKPRDARLVDSACLVTGHAGVATSRSARG